jgi:hypothetical protein
MAYHVNPHLNNMRYSKKRKVKNNGKTAETESYQWQSNYDDQSSETGSFSSFRIGEILIISRTVQDT